MALGFGKKNIQSQESLHIQFHGGYHCIYEGQLHAKVKYTFYHNQPGFTSQTAIWGAFEWIFYLYFNFISNLTSVGKVVSTFKTYNGFFIQKKGG
jgi:hypothetical protein